MTPGLGDVMTDIGAISRILKLVSLLSDHREVTAKQAAAVLGLPVSTAHRLLRKLADLEFASQAERGSFSAGMELYRIAGRLISQVPFASIAEPMLAALTERFNETSMLTILERRQLRMYFAISAAPPDPMRYVIELNKTAPLIWGASGRVLLAHLGEEEIQRAIDTAATTDVRGATIDPAELRADLEKIRAQGFAISFSHRTLNSIGIAAPFFDARGEIVGALAFQIPAFRYQEAALGELTGALKENAAKISRKIGARPGN